MSVDKFGCSSSASASARASTDTTESKSTTEKFITLSQNLATKVSQSGDTMNGNLDILLNDDSIRRFGVSGIKVDQQVSLLLGDIHNQIVNIFGRPIVISGYHGIKISCSKGEVCLLGNGSNAKSEFFQDITMNGKTITNLKEPTSQLDAATKFYVDNKCANISATAAHDVSATLVAQIAAIVPPSIPHYVKNNVGIVPPIASGNAKNGYVVTASTNTETAFNVFSITSREWASAGINRDFWIQIKLPGPLIIWQISLRGKHGNTGQLTSLMLKGSLEGVIWDNLMTNQILLMNTITFLQYGEVLTVPYMYYRIHLLEAEGINPGLSHWQLYSLDPLV